MFNSQNISKRLQDLIVLSLKLDNIFIKINLFFLASSKRPIAPKDTGPLKVFRHNFMTDSVVCLVVDEQANKTLKKVECVSVSSSSSSQLDEMDILFS